MFAIIASMKYGGEAVLIDTARTLPAAQRKWHKHFPVEAPNPYKCIGILTPSGLVNYYGKRIAPGVMGYIHVTMGVAYL